MALSIGELVGYIDLDSGAAEGALGKMEGLLSGAKSKWSLLLGGAGVAAGGAFAASLVGAINLEPGRDKVAAALDLTSKQADRAGKVAGKVYADGWGESADEVNDALESVMSSIGGMRNASEKDLKKVTTQALIFSQTMGIDVGRAAQVAGNMIHNGMAKNATQAFDLLTKASSKVPKELREDVLDATDEYGQFFNTLGISGPQAMDLLAKGASKGMYGIDKTGDAIKEFTIRSTDMSASTKSAYKTVGLDAHKMANDILAGGNKAHKAFDRVVDGVLKIKDPTKRSNTAIKLFGTQMEDMGVKDVPKFLRSLKTGGKGLDDFKGATDRAGRTLSDNAPNNLEVFKRKLQTGFVNLIGMHVLPMVTEWTGKLDKDLGPALHAVGDVLGKVTGFLERHHTTAKVLVGVLAALVAITVAHEAILAVSAAGGMAKWLMQTKLISAATKVWTAMEWALNAAMDANPIMLVVLGIAALVAAFVIAYNKSEKFRAIVQGALHGVMAAGKAVGGFFAHTLPDFFVKAWDKVKSVTTGGADKVVGFVKSLPGRIGRALVDLVRLYTLPYRLAGKAAYDLIQKYGGNVVDFVRGVPGKLVSLAGKFAGAGKSLLSGFFDGAKDFVTKGLPGLGNRILQGIVAIVNDVIRGINTAIPDKISIPHAPDIDLPDNPLPEIHLRTGGRTKANSPGMAWIGDANEPESVLRDSQLKVLLMAAVSAASARQPQRGHDGPLIGEVNMQPGESVGTLADRLWFLTRTRG